MFIYVSNKAFGNNNTLNIKEEFVVDKKLVYTQGPLATHTLNSEYFWYEIGDVISIGDKNALYYCFPKIDGVVTKTRLATEELYKITKDKIKVNL